MKIVFGIIAMIVGALMVIYTEVVLQTFGRSDWAEEHLSGGSRFFYKLFGIGLFFIALIIMTGLGGEILLSVFGKLFGM